MATTPAPFRGFAVRLSTVEPVQHLVGLAVCAERAGAAAVVVDDGGQGRDVLVTATAIAVATASVRLVLVGARLDAPGVATVDELAGGRARAATVGPGGTVPLRVVEPRQARRARSLGAEALILTGTDPDALARATADLGAGVGARADGERPWVAWSVPGTVDPDRLVAARATARPDGLVVGLPHHEVADVAGAARVAAEVLAPTGARRP